jgi:hypothetical protein
MAPQRKIVPDSPLHYLDYQPPPRPLYPFLKAAKIRQDLLAGTAPCQNRPNIGDAAAAIPGSLDALAEKYSIDEFTIATSDGLVLASNGAVCATDDAARFGGTHGIEGDSPLVTILPFFWNGFDLKAIIRTHTKIPERYIPMIERDTQEILNRWI